jgi:Tol biopolymer transport system component
MTISAPPRPPSRAPAAPDSKRLEREEVEALVEALIEEARRETRRRHRRYWAVAALVTFVGVVVLTLLEGGAASQTASPAISARLNAAAQAVTSKIAFTRSAAGGQKRGGLYVMNADGSGKRRLADSGNFPSWSPDGRKIAFGGLRVVNADGSGLQRLTSGTLPAWSPDGRRIAFTLGGYVRSKGLYSDIHVINADGSGEQKLTNSDGGRPFWSPDGQKIAFTRRQPRFSSNFDIYVMNADGSGRRHLARTSYGSHPAWSPDGRQIAFVRGYDVWVMNADGSGQRRLTRGAARDLAPSWSPDGRTIAFDRRVGRGRSGQQGSKALSYEIYVMNADGSGQRRLARGAGPLWSPDGKKIAFSRALGNGVGSPYPDNWEIFVMNADGSEQRNLTRNRRWDDIRFAWSPAQR